MDETVGPGLWVELGLDPSGLGTGAEEAKQKLEELDTQVKTASKSTEDWMKDIKTLAIPTVALGTAVYMTTQKYGDMASELKDLSKQTGITTGKLQQLQYAALLSNTDISKLSLALTTLTLSLGDAADEASPAYKAFMGLGIDPKGRTPDEVFDDLALALHNIEDPTKRAAVAQDIFGKSWKEMLPYMDTYLEKQEEIKKSPAYSEKDLQNLEDAKIAWDKLTNSLTIYTGKLISLIDTVQSRMNELNPIYQLMNGGEFDIGATVSDVANAATLGQMDKLKNAINDKKISDALKKNETMINQIIINNPVGTPSQNAAAVKQASRDLAREL